MYGINLKSERGNILITVLIIIVFIGLLALVAATLTTSENRSQIINAEEQRAFYAAQSGIEYALKRIVSSDTLSEWSEEDIPMGNGSTVDVNVEFVDNNTLQVEAVGKSERYVKKLKTTVSLLDSSDISRYAVYSAKTVEGVVTRDSTGGEHNQSLIMDNASKFPAFNEDSLKVIAQNEGYYFSGDLTVNASFSPPPGTVVFVEGNLRFVKGNWDGGVHFVTMGDVIFNPSWKNSANVSMTIYQANPEGSVYVQPAGEGEDDEESVDFDIENGNVIPNESFAAQVTIVGSAISYGGWYDIPVTVKCFVDEDEYTPFGDFEKAVNGNVNDGENPRVYTFPDIYPPNTPISISGRSWLKKFYWYSGKSNNHWMPFMTVNSSDNSPYVLVLRDGDEVPDIPGFLDQNSIEDFLQPYIDFESHTVDLEDNQAIYLFELGTSDLDSPAADFQDLVVLVTLAKDQESLAQSEHGNDGQEQEGKEEGEDENVTYLTFTGGIIAKGNVNGKFSSGEEEDDDHASKMIEIIHDQQLMRDFLSLSFNAGPRVILSSKWSSRD